MRPALVAAIGRIPRTFAKVRVAAASAKSPRSVAPHKAQAALRLLAQVALLVEAEPSRSLVE